MLKKHMAACLIATAFAAAPAFAQNQPSGSTDRPAATGSGSTTTGSPAMQPSMSNSSTSSSSMNQGAGAMQGQFMTQMQPNQMMASDLIGTKVISANNESIGDINDVIVDRNGQAIAAVVGVGGFLGIGEKDVAVPFKSLEFASREQVSAMNNNNASQNSGNSPSTTGSTASSGTASSTSAMANNTANTNAQRSAASSSNANEPERVILRMTKAELQAAPTFDKDGDSNNNTNRTTGSTGTAPNTTAPKP